jgi:hypothetical protein
MEGIYLTSSEPGVPTQELRTRLSFGVSSLAAEVSSAEELPERARDDLERRRPAPQGSAATDG